MLGTILISIIVFLLLLLTALTILQLWSKYRTHQMKEISYLPVRIKNWPTREWDYSSPEAQGVQSSKLLEMVDYYQNKHNKNQEILIDSITIIRNERIIADLYFNPLFPKDTKHIINSCTKSIVGVLIGIAIDKGYIKNVRVPILDFFKEVNLSNKDERLTSMTIQDLLTMRTGWHSQDSYLYQWTGLFKMQASDNWIEYILNLPFETSPDSRFDYSNLASFLLSAIITKATGMDTFSFAKKYLFTPLGITDIHWDKSPEGIYMGFARMWLKPHDLAKVGLLLLQKGKWEDQQIVPRSWVEDSIHAHSFPKQYRYIYRKKDKKNFGVSGANWIFSNLLRPFTDGYGYQWWLDESGMFSAIGVGGQYMMVVPKERLIVIVSSKLKGKDTFLPVALLKRFILPAIQSNTPIPDNKIAQQKLSIYAVPPSLSKEIKPTDELPATAWKISGKEYVLSDLINLNPWQHNRLLLQFTPLQDYAVFRHRTINNELIQYEIGLNNLYRITASNDKSYAAKGRWTSAYTFTIDFEIIGYSSKGQWILTYHNDKIEVTESGATGTYHYQGKLLKKELSQTAKTQL